MASLGTTLVPVVSSLFPRCDCCRGVVFVMEVVVCPFFLRFSVCLVKRSDKMRAKWMCDCDCDG